MANLASIIGYYIIKYSFTFIKDIHIKLNYIILSNSFSKSQYIAFHSREVMAKTNYQKQKMVK